MLKLAIHFIVFIFASFSKYQFIGNLFHLEPHPVSSPTPLQIISKQTIVGHFIHIS